VSDVKRYTISQGFCIDGSPDVLVMARDYDALDAAATALGIEVQRLNAELIKMKDKRFSLFIEIERFRAALKKAATDLQTVGDDYPGSSCQQWCRSRAREARELLDAEPDLPSADDILGATEAVAGERSE
jgi:hypothetical protein